MHARTHHVLYIKSVFMCIVTTLETVKVASLFIICPLLYSIIVIIPVHQCTRAHGSSWLSKKGEFMFSFSGVKVSISITQL